jgi:hypothetical protein
MIAMPLGIALIIFHFIDKRKKSKITITNKADEWEEKTFINSYNLKDRYEQRYS